MTQMEKQESFERNIAQLLLSDPDSVLLAIELYNNGRFNPKRIAKCAVQHMITDDWQGYNSPAHFNSKLYATKNDDNICESIIFNYNNLSINAQTNHITLIKGNLNLSEKLAGNCYNKSLIKHETFNSARGYFHVHLDFPLNYNEYKRIYPWNMSSATYYVVVTHTDLIANNIKDRYITREQYISFLENKITMVRKKLTENLLKNIRNILALKNTKKVEVKLLQK